MLTAIDPVTNESPLIQPAFSMQGEQAAEVLDRKCSESGYPEFLQCAMVLNSESGKYPNGARTITSNKYSHVRENRQTTALLKVSTGLAE